MKRSMNVNIFLKQFKLPNADIVALVKEGKAEEINAERLKGLLKIMPERDEVSMRQSLLLYCNILIRGVHKWSALLCTPPWLCSTSFGMYCATHRRGHLEMGQVFTFALQGRIQDSP